MDGEVIDRTSVINLSNIPIQAPWLFKYLGKGTNGYCTVSISIDGNEVKFAAGLQGVRCNTYKNEYLLDFQLHGVIGEGADNELTQPINMDNESYQEPKGDTDTCLVAGEDVW